MSTTSKASHTAGDAPDSAIHDRGSEPSQQPVTADRGHDSARALLGLVRRYPVGAFLTWFFTVGQAIAFIPVVAQASGTDLPRQPFIVMSTIVGLLLPALIITWLVDGRDAVRRLLRSSVAWRRPPSWYLVALLLVPATALVLAVAVEGAPDATAGAWGVALASGFLLQLLLTTAPNNLWEEVAWTGFVQQRLQQNHSPVVAALFVGPLFALQHVSLVVGSSLLGALFLLALLAVLAIPFRFLTGWVWNRTHSLLLVGLLHGAGNAAAGGSGFAEGLLPRLYPGTAVAFSAHLFAFAAIGVVVLLVTRRTLGRSSSR